MRALLVSLLLLALACAVVAAPAPLPRKSRQARITSDESVRWGVVYTETGAGYLVTACPPIKPGRVSTSIRLEVGDVVLSIGGVRCVGSGRRLDKLTDAANGTNNAMIVVLDIRTGNELKATFTVPPRR